MISKLIEDIRDLLGVSRNKRLARIKYYNDESVKMKVANQEFLNMTTEQSKYFTNSMKVEWENKYSDLYNVAKKTRKYKKLKLDKEVVQQIKTFRNNYYNIDQIRIGYNADFVEQEKKRYTKLFDNVEGRSLDDQQRDCIVKDEVNNLVVAGAGSGKTTTIVGKIKYLLDSYEYNPKELLVLSFTNASASEMSERLKKETNKDIDVMTFHKLGKEIIANVEGKQPSITNIHFDDFIKEEFNSLTKDEQYNNLLNRYFISYMKEYKSRFDFKNEGDYIDYLRDNNIRTFKNEIVKSYEEMEISNFFYINNIDYKYEHYYEIDTADKKYSRYRPDFYLPQYDVYIEHFGIDRKGNVPSFFKGKDGLSAKEVYNNGIKWKRQLHEENDTKLIETYSYEKQDGVLLKNLKDKLEAEGVDFNPKSRNEVWNTIEKDKKLELSSLIRLMATFIMLMKTNNLSIEELLMKNKAQYKGFHRSRNEIFISLVQPLYMLYENELQKLNEIDFSDMINKASRYVEDGMFNRKYTYIIVDEYQDISLPRYNLVKAIKSKNNSKLFCVGDDWQSIYRFAGSDVDLFVNFEKYFGFTEKSYIETTYRFNSSLIELSSRFILKNSRQIKKKLKSYNCNNDKSYDVIYGSNTSELFYKLRETLNSLPHQSSVALLGRYKDDLKQFLGQDLTCRYNNHLKRYVITYNNRLDLKLDFLTAHKSKGLQADYVFILNNCNGRYGFPSNIEDDKVLNLLLQQKDDFDYAEERRLYYVAITRAKKHLYILVDENKKSPFVRELEDDFGLLEVASTVNVKSCPKCIKGKLVQRSGKYGLFLGCSNYPLCKHTEKFKKYERIN